MQTWWSSASVAFLFSTSLSGCSSPSAPAAGARVPATTSSAPASTSSAMPVATPNGGVSSEPAASAAPPASATPPATGGGRLSPDGKLCGGIAGFRCADKQYCSFPIGARCGAGDMAGECKPIPEMCTLEFAPVCGCDGKTYATACVAGRSSVSVASNGACAGDSGSGMAEGKLCGTRGVAGECAAGLFCAFSSQCGATDSGGKCTKKPEVCPHLAAPVCGCDGQTYSNGCEAERNGVSVAAKGACKPK